VLGRFISADSIIPGAASGSGGGAGTLGVDSSSHLTTLTTDFHEFIGQVTQENQAVLQYGPFFQWSEKVRKDNPVPSGPLNPQALNRYSYGLNNPVKYQDPSGHMPTDGCQTEGCATDEDWAENFIKGILHTTDLTDPNDNPKGQLTLHFYQWTLDHYTPEAGPITPGDVLRDAWHAAATHVKASGLSAAQDLEHMRRMGVVLDIGVVMGATALTQRWKAMGYEYVANRRFQQVTANSVENKAYRYFLNPTHPDGGPKAQWFERALGYTRANMDDLTRQIVYDPLNVTPTEMTPFGQKYLQMINIIGSNGKTIEVPFIWIHNLDGFMRLVTVPWIPK
jgi:hypothetical protein